MTIERALRLIAGFFVASSAALAYWHSPYWLIFTGFVGLNLFQSGFTNWCPMMWILKKAGLDGEKSTTGSDEESHRKQMAGTTV
ncbi:MAG: DUF2892 domain-containing protein [Planctomycetes bacterium]|nr:DUF2892 domain-containing protein [Planctomycetota bacterium]